MRSCSSNDFNHTTDDLPHIIEMFIFSRCPSALDTYPLLWSPPGASSVMLKNCLIVTALLLPGGIINAQQLATDPLRAIVQHPNHCAIYLGGPDHAADSADRAYGEALAAAVSSLGGSAGSALSHIRTACLARPVTSTDPERPKSPTSS